jgi:hypothetical protein
MKSSVMTTNEHILVTSLAITSAVIGILTTLGAVLARGINDPVLTFRLGLAAATCAVLFLICLCRTIALAKRRRLDAKQRAELLNDVRKMPAVPALVSAPKDDEEARSYARQLLAVLREAGWPVHGVRRVESDHDVADAEVLFGVRDPTAPPPGAMQLYFSLQRVGVDVEIARSGQAPASGVELFVGHRT